MPKVVALLEQAESDILAFYAFPAPHWTKLRSTNPLERFNKEIGRRTDVVGIFPNDQALIRLAGMLCIEQNDEWLVGRAYLSAESISELVDSHEQNSQDRRAEKRRNLSHKERRWPSSSRPEQPTPSPTRSALRSYTTSRDLTAPTIERVARIPGARCCHTATAAAWARTRGPPLTRASESGEG
jgi:hypothetical protein